MSVAQFHSEEKPLMPLTPQEQVRMAEIRRQVPILAEAIYRADKGSKLAKLADLRTFAARAVYLAEAEMILGPESRHERVTRVNQVQAETFAYADKDAEDVVWQARQDVVRFGGRHLGQVTPIVSHFGPAPGVCFICRQRVGAIGGATLHISEILIADVHAECAMNDARCTPVSKISFLLKGESR